TRFSRDWSSDVCSSDLAGLMSGRYQARYNVEAPLPTAPRAQGLGLTAEGHSLPQLLKTAGYDTALLGKWHLGYAPDQRPLAHGSDYFFGCKGGFVDYYQRTNSDGELDLWEQDQTVEEEGYLTDLITSRAVGYINEERSEPFFLSVQYNAPHWPYQPPGKPSVAPRNAAHLQPWEEDPGTRADYVAMPEHVDQGIGQILDALDEAAIAAETLVIYTNDNGGEWLSRNAPLTNRKFSVWEGGIRVPAIMRWPGVIPADQVTDQVGITMDFTATMLAAAGAELPEGYTPEGIDLMPIVTGASPVVERSLFWRAGTASAVRSGDLKRIQQGPQTFFVFNVSEDPAERDDLTRTSQADAARLHALLEAWKEDVDAERELRR